MAEKPGKVTYICFSVRCLQIFEEASNSFSSLNSAAKSAIAAAEAAVKKAAKAGGEWRDSKKKFIKKAKAAASKKDYKKAIKLANKAKAEGEMGYKQAMAEKDAKPWLF